jgi:Golgi apyrase
VGRKWFERRQRFNLRDVISRFHPPTTVLLRYRAPLQRGYYLLYSTTSTTCNPWETNVRPTLLHSGNTPPQLAFVMFTVLIGECIGQWGVIIDAGSSGTRAYVYKWIDPSTVDFTEGIASARALPEITLVRVKKNRPGISTFAERPSDVGEHLQPLIDAAIAAIPPESTFDTPIFFMATAGMRLVPRIQQASILQQTCSYLLRSSPFRLSDCERHVRVIPGETEGLYGWLAANYLLDGFDSTDNRDGSTHHNTYGFLDMGGASTQIVFSPNTTEAALHDNDLSLIRLRRLDGSAAEYRVFSTSFLGFGARAARQRYVESLEERYSTSKMIRLPDPCMPRGLTTTANGSLVAPDDVLSEPVLVGTGDFEECLNQTFPLLRKDAPCDDFPCLFNGQHVPGIDFDVTRFVGVSDYWHVTNGAFPNSGSKPYDLASYKDSAIYFCNQAWLDIQGSVLPRKKDSSRKLQDMQELCFRASWFINILYRGIGVPMAGLNEAQATQLNATSDAVLDDQEAIEHFTPINKVEGTELSWTMGAMLLHVTGLIPPLNMSLPVGLGHDVAGLDTDFEEWGPVHDAGSSLSIQTRPTRAIVVLAVIMIGMAFLGFIVCIRYKRTRSCRKIAKRTRRRRRPSGNGWKSWIRFFSARFEWGSTYERLGVLEEGLRRDSDAPDSTSDDSDGSTAFSTPAQFGLRTFKDGSERIGERNPDPSIDRSGLVVRTESRDRLTYPVLMSNVGKRSRASSPTRLNSPSASTTRDY